MAQAKDSDALFADCAEELKALLRRGGAILFDKVVTGPAARRFLKEAGVFDPTATAEPCPVARWAYWGDGVPTDHALFTASGRPWHGRSQSRLVYRDRDRKNPFSPVRIRLDRNLSVLVLQENVYGKGRVVISENFLAFTDWYEQVEYGDSLLSWIIGMPVTKHAEKVERLRGGPGVEVVR